MGGAGGLMDADDLGGASGVEGGDFAFGADALASDDEGVLAAEAGVDGCEGLLHGAGGGGVGEVEEGLVAEARVEEIG